MTNTQEYVLDIHYLLINIKVKEGCLNQVLSLIYDSIAPTHKEEGCSVYKLLHENNDITVYGSWKSKMSLDMHLLFQYHLKLFEEQLPSLCECIEIKTLREIEPPITSLSLSS